jgi:hypothetical protein
MTRTLLMLACVLSASRLEAAIAFDNKASCGSGTSTATCSSFVVAATNPAIVVGATSSLGDNLTGCTFNGVAMVQVDKQLAGAGVAFRYLYLLTANSGTHDVVCVSSSGTTYADAVSYTGVNQSNTPDASGKNSSGAGVAPLDIAVTVVAANCWLVAAGENDGAANLGFATDVSARQANSSYAGIGIGDSNGTVGAGARTARITTTGTGILYGIAASLAPATGGGTTTTCTGAMTTQGAGGCH